MIKTRKVLSFALFIALLLNLCSFFYANSEENLTKIAILSDVHIDSTRDTEKNKYIAALNTINRMNNIDAIAFVGDNTNNGREAEHKAFRQIYDEMIDTESMKMTAVMGNHEFYNYGWGVDVGRNPGMLEQMQGWFTKNVGVGIEHEIVVNGVHVLSVSPDNEMDLYQPREAFLKSKITAAAAESPTKPIIIISHKAVKYTNISSGEAPDGSTRGDAADWSDDFLNFMDNYPQIIYISGHAHDDIRDERSIYQQNYTTVHAGVISGEPSSGLILSIDEDNVVTIARKNYADGSDLAEPWVVDVKAVVESKDNFLYRKHNAVTGLNLALSDNQTSLHANWINSTFYQAKLEILKASDMVDGVPANVSVISPYESGKAKEPGHFYNRALIENLEPDVQYLYRVGNENGWTEYANISIKSADDSFNFLFMGDPQIGAKALKADGESWKNTVNKALTAFPQAEFIVTSGNNVSYGGDTSQFSAFLAPDAFKSVPLFTTLGNKEATTYVYSQYFSYPSMSKYGQTSSAGKNSGDYSYVKNNALFMVINSNNTEYNQHRNFLQETIQKAGKDIKWKIVVMHHSIFGSSEEADTEQIRSRRENFASLFSDLEIDLALMGNDYTYSRSKLMQGGVAVDGSSGEAVSKTEGNQVLYLTANSSTGSKFNPLSKKQDYIAVNGQNNESQFSNIEITDQAIAVTTYNAKDLSKTDSFKLSKADDMVLNEKPFIYLPVENRVLLNAAFNAMNGVSAVSSDGADLTGSVSVTGSVNAGKEGTYQLTYSVADAKGRTTTVKRVVSVLNQDDFEGIALYYGLDLTNGTVEAKDETIPQTAAEVPIGFSVEKDKILNSNILQMVDEQRAVISGMDIKDFNNRYTIEMYVYIEKEALKNDDGFELFQFGNQNINVCGFNDPIVFYGAGKNGNNDVDLDKEPASLPYGRWVHIVLTAKDREQVMYVDGSLYNKSTQRLNFSSSNFTDYNLYLGCTNTGRSSDMKIASFNMYKGFSSQNMVENLYETNRDFYIFADYSEVDKAIASIPANLYDYTNESVENVILAQKAIIRGLNVREQDAVDDMASKLKTAVSELKLKVQTEFSITLSSDENGEIYANKTLASKDDKIKLMALANEGYVFKAWEIIEGNITVTDNSFIMPGKNVSVKAVFEKKPEPIEREIVIENNGGNGSESVTVRDGAKVWDYLSKPAKEYFDFAGWYTDEELINELSKDAPAHDGLKLFAKWNPIQVKLSGVPNANKIKVGERFTLVPSIDAKTGSEGWTWDEAVFKASFNSSATFTAQKAGKTVIKYLAVNGTEAEVTVEVAAENQATPTGEKDTLPMILFFAISSAFVLILGFRKKKI